MANYRTKSGIRKKRTAGKADVMAKNAGREFRLRDRPIPLSKSHLRFDRRAHEISNVVVRR